MKILLGLIPILLVIGIVPAFATESVLIHEFGSIPEDVEQQIKVNINGVWYSFNYFTTNVSVNSVEADLDFISLIFDVNVPSEIQPQQTEEPEPVCGAGTELVYDICQVIELEPIPEGVLRITIPRDAFDSKFNGLDDDFIILANGDEAEFNEIETTSTHRTLEIHLPAGTEEIEIIGTVFALPIEPITSSIGAKSANDDIIIGQQTIVNVTFFNLETLNAQKHVDYSITILKSSGESIFKTTIMHTSTGVVNFPVVFPEFDRYTMVVDVVGILFQPIPVETFSFEILALDPEPLPDRRFDGKWKLNLKGFIANSDKEKLQKASLSAIWIIDGNESILKDVKFKTKLVKNYQLKEFSTENLRNPETGFNLSILFVTPNSDNTLQLDLELDDFMDHFIEYRKKGMMMAEGKLYDRNGDRYFTHDIGLFGIVKPMK